MWVPMAVSIKPRADSSSPTATATIPPHVCLAWPIPARTPESWPVALITARCTSPAKPMATLWKRASGSILRATIWACSLRAPALAHAPSQHSMPTPSLSLTSQARTSLVRRPLVKTGCRRASLLRSLILPVSGPPLRCSVSRFCCMKTITTN